MDNWHFIYNANGFDEVSVKDLSLRLEKLGYKYHQCTGLGAGPSAEQVIVWVHNNQFLVNVSVGVLTSFIYDLLKSLYLWFSSHNNKKNIIPMMELFLDFKDVDAKNISVRLKFRMDEQYDKKTLSTIISSQTKTIHAASHKNAGNRQSR